MKRKTQSHPIKKCTFSTVLVLSIMVALAQPSLAQYDWMLKIDQEQWFKGKVELTDGHILYGRMNPSSLHYYVLMMKSGDKVNSLKCNDIRSFEFYDEKVKRHRRFQYLNFKEKDSETGVMKAGLFEVLAEFDNFALFSEEITFSPPNKAPIMKKETPVSYAAVSGGAVVPSDEEEEVPYHNFAHQENIIGKERVYYLSNQTGKGNYKSFASAGKSSIGQTKAMFDEHMMQKITKERYKKIQKYAEKYNLDYNNNTEHLVKVMNYYKSIL